MTENHLTKTIDSKKREYAYSVLPSSSSTAPALAAGHSQLHPLANGSHHTDQASKAITSYPRTHHHPYYGGYGNTYTPYPTWHYPPGPTSTRYLPAPSVPAKGNEHSGPEAKALNKSSTVASEEKSRVTTSANVVPAAAFTHPYAVPQVTDTTGTTSVSKNLQHFEKPLNTKSTKNPSTTEQKLGEKDIQCSPGDTVEYNSHRGNQRFLQMIGANRGMYYWKLSTQKKTLLIRKIVDFVTSAGSRFLTQKKSGSNKEWYDIGFCRSCQLVAALLKRDGDGETNLDRQTDNEEELNFSELEEQKSKFDELGSSKFVVPPHIQKWYYPPQKVSPPQSKAEHTRPAYLHDLNAKGRGGWYPYASTYYPYSQYPSAAYSHPHAWNSYPATTGYSANSWHQAHHEYNQTASGPVASQRANPPQKVPTASLVPQNPSKRQRTESPPAPHGDARPTVSSEHQGDKSSSYPKKVDTKSNPPVSLMQVGSKAGVARRVSGDTSVIVVPADTSPDSKNPTPSGIPETAIVNEVKNTEQKYVVSMQGSEENTGNISGLAALSAAAFLRLCDHAH